MDICFSTQKTPDSETCIACRVCCEYEALTLANYKQLELAYHKGHNVLYDPVLNTWYMLLSWKCPHISEDGCDIYDHPNKPELCSSWECPKAGKMVWRNKILLVAGQRICKQLFGEKINV